MTSYVTSRDGQKITARKIRECLEAIPAPEPKIRLALRLLADAFRDGTLEVSPQGVAGPYAGYAALTLGIYSSCDDGPVTRYHFHKSKKFAAALAWMADYALED